MRYGNSFPACFLVFLFVILFGSTYGYTESVRGVTDTTIKIGVIMDLTGPSAGDIGLPITEALKNYTRYINESGGIFGRRIKLIVEDDRYAIPAGIAAFKKLLFRDRMFGFVGPGNTGAGRILYPKLDKHKVPTLAAVPDEFTVKPLKRHIFFPATIYDDHIGVIFDYIIHDLKPKELNMTFVYFDAESGKVGLTSAEKWAKHFNVHFDKEIISMGALDATSQVMNIKRNKSTHIIIHHTSPAAAALLRDLHKFGLHIPVFGTLINCTEDTVRMAGSASRNYMGAHSFGSWYDDSEGIKMMRRITLKYKPGTEKPHRTNIYTAAWVLSTVFYEGFYRAGKDLTVESLVAGLESIKDLDTKGICGAISFSHTDHKGLYHSKIFKADPESGTLVPITDWRRTPKKNER